MFNNNILREVFDNVIFDRSIIHYSHKTESVRSVARRLQRYRSGPYKKVYKSLMYAPCSHNIFDEFLDYIELVEYICLKVKNPVCLILLEKLHNKGYNISKRFSIGNPIFILLQLDNIEAIKLILKYYPDSLKNACEPDDPNPLCWCRSPEGLNLVLEHYKDRINEVNNRYFKETPLICLVKYMNYIDIKSETAAACFKLMLDNGADPNIERYYLLRMIEFAPEKFQALVKPMLGLSHPPKIQETDKEQYIILSPEEEKNKKINYINKKIYSYYEHVPFSKDDKYIAKIKNNEILEIIKLEDQPEMDFLLSKNLFGYQVNSIERVKSMILSGDILPETFRGIIVKSTHYKPYSDKKKIRGDQAVIDFDKYKDIPHKTLMNLGIITETEYQDFYYNIVDTEIFRLADKMINHLEQYKTTKYVKGKYSNLYKYLQKLKTNKKPYSSK